MELHYTYAMNGFPSFNGVSLKAVYSVELSMTDQMVLPNMTDQMALPNMTDQMLLLSE